jgi:hypothetical protein
VGLVLSSDWRKDSSLEELRERVFDRTGFAHLLIDKTDDNAERRDVQVRAWLQERRCKVDAFVILDDKDFGFSQSFSDQFVMVNPARLLTEAKAEEAYAKIMRQLRVGMESVPVHGKRIETSQSSQKNFSCYLFLEIEGVLLVRSMSLAQQLLIEKKRKELFGLKGLYSDLERHVASSHFFHPDSVSRLEELIQNIRSVAQMHIVLSSNWRKGLSIEELQKKVFCRTKFAELIVDKTLDDGRRREEQVQNWLEERAQTNSVDSFVILDARDLGLSQKFPQHFVQTDSHELITQAIMDKVYRVVMGQLSLVMKKALAHA